MSLFWGVFCCVRARFLGIRGDGISGFGDDSDRATNDKLGVQSDVALASEPSGARDRQRSPAMACRDDLCGFRLAHRVQLG